MHGCNTGFNPWFNGMMGINDNGDEGIQLFSPGFNPWFNGMMGINFLGCAIISPVSIVSILGLMD